MKVGLLIVVIISVSTVGLSGCGQDESLASVCKRMVSCGQFTTSADCETMMGAFILSSPCLKAMQSASCEEHASDSPSYWAVCWDQCAIDGQHCAGDTIQVCTNGWELLMDCDGVCAANDGSYVGSCGIEYQGQTSEQDVCWCE